MEKIIFKNATKDEARSIKTRKETFKGETKGKRERNFEMEIKMNFRNSLKKKRIQKENGTRMKRWTQEKNKQTEDGDHKEEG